MNYPKTKQQGFTLIEVLVGLLVGLIAVAAAVSLVNGVVISNNANMKAARLNQELRAVMDVMTRDLKRAGYSPFATGITSVNPFITSPNSIYIGIAENSAGSAAAGTTGNCITFAYSDITGDAVVNANEQFGYRRVTTSGTGIVQTRTNGVSCAATNSWDKFTDDRVINITTLRFQNKSLDIDSPADGIIDIRYIGITLTGQLISDPTVTRTLTELVRVRNDTP